MTEVVAVGFVPSTPLLIPDLAGPIPGEPDHIRAAAREVVAAILSCQPDRVVVVGACQNPDLDDADSTWDFSGFGLPPRRRREGQPLPWQLGLGAWLLDDHGWAGARKYVGAPSVAADLGSGRTAFLAVGDGSVHFAEQLPDNDEAEREAFDAGVARAVADGEVALLAKLAAMTSDAIGASGPTVWHYIGTAVRDARISTSRLVYDAAPFGVHYVAGWWLL
jgi:hypothetical protein